jgi:hypothetical protein
MRAPESGPAGIGGVFHLGRELPQELAGQQVIRVNDAGRAPLVDDTIGDEWVADQPITHRHVRVLGQAQLPYVFHTDLHRGAVILLIGTIAEDRPLIKTAVRALRE